MPMIDLRFAYERNVLSQSFADSASWSSSSETHFSCRLFKLDPMQPCKNVAFFEGTQLERCTDISKAAVGSKEFDSLAQDRASRCFNLPSMSDGDFEPDSKVGEHL